ncbi:GM17551 [Drosophila sechellia]|uniref:GM17551 n=1 Tax=Drosophila sechellia TaxID=7238 RepID=B4IGD5_DROSE|nr:GM17551 [Drosophila sechellia]
MDLQIVSFAHLLSKGRGIAGGVLCGLHWTPPARVAPPNDSRGREAGSAATAAGGTKSPACRRQTHDVAQTQDAGHGTTDC